MNRLYPKWLPPVGARISVSPASSSTSSTQEVRSTSATIASTDAPTIPTSVPMEESEEPEQFPAPEIADESETEQPAETTTTPMEETSIVDNVLSGQTPMQVDATVVPPSEESPAPSQAPT